MTRMKLLALMLSACTVAAPALARDAAPVSVATPAAPPIRADARAYLDRLAATPRPPMNEQTIAMIRKVPADMIAQMLSASEAPIGALAVDRKLTMPGPGGNMDLRLFDSRAERGPGPVVVFYHGGGFVVGSIGTHAALAAEMSRQLDLPVVSVEYRLAPEHKWPAAPDDAEAAARWIAANGATLGRQINGLVLTGDSAGGTLTLLTALALRDRPAAAPLRLMIPLYPMADASKTYPSMETLSTDYGLNKGDMEFFERAFAADKQSPRYSALLADLHGLPPTVLATAALDPLRDSGRAFAGKLIDAGVPLSYYEAQGNIHGYATFRRGIPSSQGDLDTIMAMARTMLASAQTGK